jgi:hypothetical protein
MKGIEIFAGWSVGTLEALKALEALRTLGTL